MVKMKNNDVEDKGTVSVIIPVYQAEKYILRCVSSVINQTYKKIEILMLDDGSIDGSIGICNKLAEMDSRIRVFHHENIGVAATRNRGLDYANGEFIYFLDSDDWIDKNTLASMVSSMEEQNADLCICGFNYATEEYAKERSFTANCQMDKSTFLDKYFWNLYENSVLFNIGTKLYRRSIIENNNLRFCTNMVIYEDIRFFLDYMDNANQIFLCGKPYYYYFQGNTSSILHVYKNGFWESTSEYCYILLERFKESSAFLKKAVVLSLYRAYLQECHNPVLNKKNFCLMLEENCFPIVKNLTIKKKRTGDFSLDQKLFMYLISWNALFPLWLIAVFISVKGKLKRRIRKI